MKILKSIAFVAGLALITMNTSAQERNNMTPEQMAQKQTNNIKEKISGITSDQETKILAVEQEAANAMQDARSSSNGDKDAMRSKMKPIRETRDAKLKAIFTTEQYTQYQAMEESHMGSHQGGRNQ
jgi:hypothetical protein